MAGQPASLSKFSWSKVLRFSKPKHCDAGLGRGLINGQPNAYVDAPTNVRRWGGKRPQRGHRGMSANDPGRVKTRSVLFVGGVSGDPGGIVRLGAANSAEL